jgi:sterol desaturase/sphingolipid hydroxylase (fatty acid hydroxylase superfamily)
MLEAEMHRRTGGRRNMPLIYIVLVLIVVGIALWLINTYIPMAGGIKAILNAVVVIVVCVWVLQAFGLWSSIVNYRLPR